MSNLYTRIIRAILICYLLFNGVIWAASPFLINSYLSELLANKNLQINEKSTIRYNPFISQIYISDLQVREIKSVDSDEDVKSDNDNDGLEQKYINTNLISIPSATIEFSLFKLFAKKIAIEKFEINGLKTNISKTLAHINSLPPEPLVKQPETEGTGSNWFATLTFEMPTFTINNSKVLFNLGIEPQVIEFSQLAISDFVVSQHSQSAEIDIALLFNQAPLDLDAKFELNNGVGELQYGLNLQEMSLKSLSSILSVSSNKQFQNLDGLVSLKLKQEISFTKSEISSQIQDISFLLTNFMIEQNTKQNIRMNLAELAINDGVLEVLLPHSFNDLIGQTKESEVNFMQDLTLRSNLNLQYNELLITSIGSVNSIETELVKIAQFNIPDIDILLEGGESLIQTSLVELDNITLVGGIYNTINNDVTKQDSLPLLNVEKLSIADIQLTNRSLGIASIDFTKIKAAITKQKDGVIAQLVPVLPITEKQNKDKVTAQNKLTPKPSVDAELEKSDANKFALYIGKVNLNDRLSIAVSDTSVSPSYVNNIYITSFSVEPIDNSDPSVMSKIQVSGELDQYSKFNVQADIKPFNETKYIKADITVTEFDLSTITAYIKEIMAIESGQLNTVTNFIIDDDIIKGNSKLNIARVELAESVEYDESNNVDTFIPVNVALSMLKDSKGNIELDVPVEGNLDSPDFRLSGFMALLIQRATMSATKKYLMNAFVPYANIIQIGMQAGEFILKVRFQDLILLPGEDELPKSADVFLDQFSALMLDKKSTQITICALATKSDIDVQNSEKLKKYQLDKLNQLSSKRMNNFKSYMVNEHQIDSSRLLLCAPKIDIAKNAKPRLTFTN